MRDPHAARVQVLQRLRDAKVEIPQPGREYRPSQEGIPVEIL